MRPRKHADADPCELAIGWTVVGEGDKLGVEGEHARLVAPDQEERRHVLGERLQPGHVHGSRAGAFAGHWQSHGDKRRILGMMLQELP